MTSPRISKCCAPTRWAARRRIGWPRMDNPTLGALLLAWIVALAILAAVRSYRQSSGAGLTIAYMLNLFILHWVGAAIYMLPAYATRDATLTVLGLEQAVYGV